MDSLLNRYRNLLVLVSLLLGQLLLLGYQIRSNQDIPLIRVWAVTAVTPVAITLEAGRSFVSRTVGDFFTFRRVGEENRQLKREIGRLKLENQYLRNEITTADRARALRIFQERTPSKTLAARVVGNGPGPTSRVVFVDRGSMAGVQKGMAVVTPDGIVGKVAAAYPTASVVQLITDPNFAAGVISQKGRVRGILRGQDGFNTCRMDFVASEDKLEAGEWIFTSGDDRVFPKGQPVGRVRAAEHGPQFQKVIVEPSGFQNGLEEVLVVMEAVHGLIPENATQSGEVYLAPLPAADNAPEELPKVEGGVGTDADRIREKYRAVGAAQGHVFGGTVARPPDFNLPAQNAEGADPAKPQGSTQPDSSTNQTLPARPDPRRSDGAPGSNTLVPQAGNAGSHEARGSEARVPESRVDAAPARRR